jgi:hypothetical protein
MDLISYLQKYDKFLIMRPFLSVQNKYCHHIPSRHTVRSVDNIQIEQGCLLNSLLSGELTIYSYIKGMFSAFESCLIIFLVISFWCSRKLPS